MDKGLSVFEQIGRRADGRPFVVESWQTGSAAVVSYDDGSCEAVELDEAERDSIELVPPLHRASTAGATNPSDHLTAARQQHAA